MRGTVNPEVTSRIRGEHEANEGPDFDFGNYTKESDVPIFGVNVATTESKVEISPPAAAQIQTMPSGLAEEA